MTIRRVLCSGFLLLFLIQLLFFGCGNGKVEIQTPKALQSSFDKVYALYKEIGYMGMDSLSKTYSQLNNRIAYYDSALVKPPDYQKIVIMKEQLSNYMEAFNEFHEEIYSVEDKLLNLESSYKQGNIEDAELKKWVNQENALLDNIQKRISVMHKKVDSTLMVIKKYPIE